ncbi:MAG: alpha/beta hydrolase [Actinomycetota bacterium]
MGQVRFTTVDGISLEGEIRESEGRSLGAAVLCHPHPKFGGSKDHPVLWAVRNELAAHRGLTVLAFNFRGVMGSEGSHGGGKAELADVAAAVERVRGETDGPTVLVGWSFGAWVALQYALNDPTIAALALIAFPIGREVKSANRPLPELGDLERLAMPSFLLAGDNDHICPIDAMKSLSRWIPRSETAVIDGTDHFFAKRERELATRIGEWLGGVLGAQTS